MLYQDDAHRYYKMVRRRQRIQRTKGVLLIALSLALMFYAVPCFAASLWDDGYSKQSASSITFSSAINDNVYAEAASEASADQTASSEDPVAKPAYTRASAKLDPTVSETTGPGLLDDDQAVGAAKRRAQAVLVAKAEKDARIQAQELSIEPLVVEEEEEPRDLVFAYVALAVSALCAVAGIRTMLRARMMRGRAITAAYGSALRAF